MKPPFLETLVTVSTTHLTEATAERMSNEDGLETLPTIHLHLNGAFVFTKSAQTGPADLAAVIAWTQHWGN